MRPRGNLFGAKKQEKQVKRTYVTTHQLQQHKNKKPTEVLNSPRKSARLNNPQEINVVLMLAQLNNPQVNSPRRLARLNELQVNSPKKSSRLNNMNNQEVNSRRKSAKMDHAHEVNNATVNLNVNNASAKRKLDLSNPPNEDVDMGESDDTRELESMGEFENMGENLVLPPPPPMTDYERGRFINVILNHQMYKMLEEGHSGDDAVENPRKIAKKALKMKLPGGPTTRSRSNVVTAPQKDGKEKEARLPNLLLDLAAQIQLPPNEGIGSMAAYLTMRERKKEENAKKTFAVASGSGTANELVEAVDAENVLPHIGDEVEEVEVPKRTRGKTAMDKVHTRSFDKRIPVNMNKRFQPISDNDKIIFELGYFLGTLKMIVPLTCRSWKVVPDKLKNTLWGYVEQRYIIPEECKEWVLKSINASWRGYRSRIKTAHYYAYTTRKDREENRPKHIPLEDFNTLLDYWADEEIESKAKKNSESRKSMWIHTLLVQNYFPNFDTNWARIQMQHFFSRLVSEKQVASTRPMEM